MATTTPEQDNTPKADPAYKYSVELTDGRIVTFKDALAQDAARARMLMVARMDDKGVSVNETDAEFALLVVCCKINGEECFFEDYANLPLRDFNKLLPAFQKVNF